MNWYQNTILVLCCLLVSCAPYGNSENSRLMQQAQLLAEQAPDSALALLNTVNTALLGDAGKAGYTLLRVQAKDNAGMDLTPDTEILQAREYFLRGKDREKQAMACFYAAKVVFGDGQADRATLFFQEAADFAQKSGNQVLQGRALYNMGYICYDRELYADAITRYKQALQLFQSAEGQYQMEIYTLNAMGNALMIQEHTDSAQYYYKTALEQALLHDNATLKTTVYANMGVAYREQGKTETAKYYSRQALRMATTDSEKAYLFKNFAHLHLAQNNIDSARYYLEMTGLLLDDINDADRLASLYHLYSQIEKACENYQKAMEYQELFSKYREELIDRNDRQTLLEMQRKYDVAAKENQYNREKSKWWRIIGLLCAGSLTLVMLTLALQRKNRK